MKGSLPGNYPFSVQSGTHQSTIDFSTIADFDFARLMMVINLDTGDILYLPGRPQYSGKMNNGTVLKLSRDCAGMSESSPLMVIYDSPADSTTIVSVSNLPSDYPDAAAHTVLNTIANRLAAALTVTVNNLPATQTVAGTVNVGNLPATQTVSMDTAPLPDNAATATNQATTNASLQNILTALQAQIALAASIWTDDSGAFYINKLEHNQETGANTVLWLDKDGNPASPGVGLKPLTGTDLAVTNAFFDATATGTGYQDGDILARLLITDASKSPISVTAMWLNVTSGNSISAPPSSDYTEQIQHITVNGGNITVTNFPVVQAISATALPLPANAAKETGGNLDAISSGVGTTSDAAWGGSGIGTLIAIFKGIYGLLTGTLTVGGTVTANIGTTSDLAKDGVDGTGITPPSGGSGIRGWLSGIFNLLSNTISTSRTWTLSSGSDTVTAHVDNFPPIAQDGSDATGVTQLSGGVGIRGWLSGIFSKLSGTLATSRTWTLSSGSDTVNVGNFPATQTVAVNNFPATQPISGTVTVNGAVTVNGSGTPLPVNLNLVGSSAFALGQNISANSIPTVFALDQPPVPVSFATATSSDGSLTETVMVLRAILEMLTITDTTGRTRVTFDAGTTLPVVSTVSTVTAVTTVSTVTTVTTVSTVTTVASLTNIVNIGSLAASAMVIDINHLLYAQNTGSRVT